jgi:hypothetical protein
MMRRYDAILGALAAALICAFVAWIFWPKDRPTNVGQAEVLEPAKEVKTVERIIEKPKYIYVYPQAAKEDLGLPAGVIGNVNAKVTATGHLDAEERPYTLSAVLDTATGESQVYARPDPLPWIDRNITGEVGMTYGVKDGEATGRLSLRQNLVQIKSFRLGGSATLDDDGQWYAGAGAFYRW